MAAGKTYDPFAIERPTFKLGDHGEWDLADITKSNNAKLDELIAAFWKASDDPDVDVHRVAEIVGDLLETACEAAEGLRDRIVALVDEDKLGVIALRGAVQHVLEWIYGEQSAGEG